MKEERIITAIINEEGDGFVSFCPELDIASQGESEIEAKENLKEAIELFLEFASKAEIAERLPKYKTVSTLTVELPIV